VVEWQTAQQTDTDGFNLYRSRNKNEKRMEFLASIPLAPIDPLGGGAAYEYTDEDVRPGKKYYYWLEAVYIGESNTELFGPIGPVRAPK